MKRGTNSTRRSTDEEIRMYSVDEIDREQNYEDHVMELYSFVRTLSKIKY